MAYLAAHEIGELAAILGHRLDFGGKTKEEVLGACWRWLSNHSCGTFSEAWPQALRNYREYLVKHAFTAETLVRKGRPEVGELKSGLVVVLPDPVGGLVWANESFGGRRHSGTRRSGL